MICYLCGRKKVNDTRKKCNSCRTKIRRYRLKIWAVQHLGGKCKRCGSSPSLSAFEFHHVNRKKKEFDIGKMSNKSLDKIKKEINKCILLCSNCHREQHSAFNNKKFMKAVYEYDGKVKIDKIYATLA